MMMSLSQVPRLGLPHRMILFDSDATVSGSCALSTPEALADDDAGVSIFWTGATSPCGSV